jgi:hypothetical protein
MPHDDERLPPETAEDARPTRERYADPTTPLPAEQLPPTHAPLTKPTPPPAQPGWEGGTTKLTDTNIPTLMEAAFQLNTSIQNLWNTFVAFSGVVVGLLLTAQNKLTLWQRLLACAIYLMFVAVNFSALHKKYGWLGDVLASLRTAGAGLRGAELRNFRIAARRTFIPGGWLPRLSRGERPPPGWRRRSGGSKIFNRLRSQGLGFYAYLVIVLAVLAVFLISA